jgi:hypothetical protein
VTLGPEAHRLRRAGVPPGTAALVLGMPGTPRIADLERALAIVAGRHEALRLRIEARRRGLWRATVAVEQATPPVVAGAAADAIATLVPAAGRTLAAAVGPAGTVLAGLAVALDGPSLALVATEVAAALGGEVLDGPRSAWPQPPAPGAGDRWTDLLRDVPLDRPSGLPGPIDEAPGGRWRSDPDPALADLAEDTVVAGFAVALRGWSGQDTIVVDRAVRPPVDGVGPLTHLHPLVVSAEDDVAAVAARARALAEHAGGYAALRHGSADGARTFAGLAEPDARVEVGPAGVEPTDVPPHRVAAVAGADGALLVATGPGLPADLAPDLVHAWRAVLAR